MRPSCRFVNTFLVAEYIKSKMTRERDLSQVNFIDKGFESAANLLVQYQFHQGISTCCVQKLSSELEVVETHKKLGFPCHGTLKVQQGTVKGCARKKRS